MKCAHCDLREANPDLKAMTPMEDWPICSLCWFERASEVLLHPRWPEVLGRIVELERQGLGREEILEQLRQEDWLWEGWSS